MVTPSGQTGVRFLTRCFLVKKAPEKLMYCSPDMWGPCRPPGRDPENLNFRLSAGKKNSLREVRHIICSQSNMRATFQGRKRCRRNLGVSTSVPACTGMCLCMCNCHPTFSGRQSTPRGASTWAHQRGLHRRERHVFFQRVRAHTVVTPAQHSRGRGIDEYARLARDLGMNIG